MVQRQQPIMQDDPLYHRALQALERIRRRFHPELDEEEIHFVHQHIIGRIPELMLRDAVLNQLDIIEPLLDDVQFNDIFRFDGQGHAGGAHNNQFQLQFDWEQLTHRAGNE